METKVIVSKEFWFGPSRFAPAFSGGGLEPSLSGPRFASSASIPTPLFVAILLLLLALACASPPPEVRFDSVPPSSVEGPDPNRFHPPLVTLEDFQRFDRMNIEIISEEGAGAGVTGARKVVIHVDAHDQDVQLKTKNFPPFLDGVNNSPRRELAAYAIQRVFLDPVDYVVPTFGVRCVPLEVWERRNTGSPARIAGTECALVAYAFWLRNVTLPELLYDEQRFLTDGRYAYNLANFNLLTYLVGHHDQRLGNVLVSTDPDNRRVFAIDNGVSFDPFFFNWFFPPNFAWREMRVPAIPRNAVNRLRKLTEEDLERFGVILQLEADQDGILRIEEPGESIDEDEGVSVRGTTLQIGLTEGEIEAIWERIEDLLEDIDDGKLGVF
jgi:hypothetical protein